MKKIVFGILVLVLAVGFFVGKGKPGTPIKATLSDSTTKDKMSDPSYAKASAGKQDDTQKKFLFVPYWGQTAERIPDSYGNSLVYFGVAPGKDGIDTTDDGYVGLARFAAIAKGRKTFLTVRMTNSDNALAILKDEKEEQKIIDQTIAVAKQYGFSGVVLDLEVSGLPFNATTTKMDSFVKQFSESSKKESMSFSMMFFGDTFYHFRSYDIVALRDYLDFAFVMAYDLHKANGDPGPNFPLSGKETYGYDFTVMTNDFLNVLPKEKLVMVFGMFGYDWKVDADGKSLEQAQAIPLTLAKKKFLEECSLKSCVVKRDEKAAETNVSYVDEKGYKHVVWFEDEESVSAKQKFLKEKGITNVGFWAYSYY